MGGWGLLGNLLLLSEKEKHGMKQSLYPSRECCPEWDDWNFKSRLTGVPG